MYSERGNLIAWAIFKDPTKVEPKLRNELRLIRFMFDHRAQSQNVESISTYFASNGFQIDAAMQELENGMRRGIIESDGDIGNETYKLSSEFIEQAEFEKKHLRA